MPRPPRMDFPDALYHVTTRGNGRAEIFWSDEDRQRFLGQLSHHLQMTGVALYAYVLMDNHFHGLVRTPRANLSAFMQRLLTAYALYARYQQRRPGHVFQGRFKAKLVEDDVYLRGLTRYIHLNPVKIAAYRRLTGKQRLQRLNAYPWSSYSGYVTAEKVQEFVNYDVLKEFGRDQATARRQYRAFVEACVLEDDGPLLEAMANLIGLVNPQGQTTTMPLEAQRLRSRPRPASSSAAVVACRIGTSICRSGPFLWRRSMPRSPAAMELTRRC